MRLLPLIALVAIPHAAFADDELATTELTPSAIHATRDGTQAKLQIRATTRVHGPDETELTLALPNSAAITHGMIAVGGEKHELALVRAEAADAAVEAILSAAPGQFGRRWGAVVTSSITSMATVNIIAPRDAWVTLDLEVAVPTCYFENARYAEVPAAWEEALEPALRARAHALPAELRPTCFRNSSDDSIEPAIIALPATELAAEPSGEKRIGIGAGGLVLPSQRIARVELDLASRLTDVPPDLATAFVVDGSRSLTASELAVEREVVLAYTHYAKATRVQVIAYDRKAHPVLPAWSLANVAGPRIDRELQHLVPHNGSDARAGLAEAGAWLARAPGTHRVVLFTDERLPDAMQALKALDLVALLPAGTVVHVVAIAPGTAELVRDDTEYAALALATAGITVRGGVTPDTEASAEMLVRPIALERVTIEAPGWSADGGDCVPQPDDKDAPTVDQHLAEGRGCSWMLRGTPVAGPITIGGWLWGHHVTRMVRPDVTQATAIARELQSTVSSFELQPDKDALLDAAHAVNERWSLFAAWGGTGGYSDLPGRGGTGFGSLCGCGGIGDMGFGSAGIGSMTKPFSMETQLRAGLLGCKGIERNRVEITIETTLEEIVGLAVKVQPALTAVSETAEQLAAKQACAEAALWDVPLALQDPPIHATTEVVL